MTDYPARNVYYRAQELLTVLNKLSNEVLGSMPLVESAMRREIGNTNYNLLIQRAEEARALIASLNEPVNELSTDAKFAALRAALG